MNWFQKLWSNGNFHTVVAATAGALAYAPTPYSPVFAALAAIFTLPALALPGGSILPGGSAPVVPVATPVAPAPVVTLPAAVGGGTYHTVDYVNLAAALVAQFAPKPEVPARA